ncbi:MAG: glyoxylase-like metal-dependent hydrolase (beta-lactamase superfamily II) [Limisphaerales bacterium]|jgi:glyoxylase-like metal-dependent hydrolase (beta-lactamase superfamily II)
MELISIHTGTFKLDGGAMFGVVPKALWSRKITPDAFNRCTWAMRCMVVSEGDRLILIDTGLGDKQDEKFFSHFEPEGPGIEAALQAKGIAAKDITDVVLTHLHFDHSGGAIKRKGDLLVPTFPNATYWSNETHWNWAMEPNMREKASFLKENFSPLAEAGQLKFLADGESLIEGFKVHTFFGHTEAMILPHIQVKDKTLVYLADLQPSIHHFPIPWVMAYDVRPLVTIDERAKFLQNAADKDYLFFFEHDAENECCSLKQTERGVSYSELFELSNLK